MTGSTLAEKNPRLTIPKEKPTLSASDAAKSSSSGALAVFQIPSFRFQYGADLLVAWAIEMEVIILAWYVLTATDSALLLAILGALRFSGTLVAPMIGAFADGWSRKRLLVAMRIIFALLAGLLGVLAFTDSLTPTLVFVVVTLSGLLRPADMMLRQSVIADTVPKAILTNALGFFRMTVDSARMVGALVGASLMALVGMTHAYAVIVVFYVVSTLLTLRIHETHQQRSNARAQPVRDVVASFEVLKHNPSIKYLLYLAFMVNATVLSISGGLLPLVARNVYGLDSLGLGWMAAAFAGGAMLGSLTTATLMRSIAPERLMFPSAVLWHAGMVVFGQIDNPAQGIPALGLIGLLSSFVMVPMASCLLQRTPVEFRGRIMGLRQLAVFGLPLGLLVSGTLIEHGDIATTLSAYGFAGLLATLVIWAVWRRQANS